MSKIPLVARIKTYFTGLLNNKSLGSPNNISELPYLSLSPTDNVDSGDPYEQALQWALANAKEKDIKNIALTGPYGSGKSSVLKTFIKSQRGGPFTFLNISLATFKEEKTSEGDIAKKEDILRLIELSILQQIFYQEKDEKIPDSRFKKIKSHSKWSIFWASVGWTFLALSIAHLTHPELLKTVTDGQSIRPAVMSILKFITVGISLLGIITVIGKSIRALSKVRLNKFNLFDTEIEVGEKVEKSILNNHIDEIIYFFEVTPYNVVVIEDLDRFNQTEIFTKLREINLILNMSKQVNKAVIFIYAVRDDMFQDKDRAKFFDYIIPIIPVINSTNSSQKLIQYRDANKYLWTNDLIENLAIFINDMRLLYNITNEFYLYHKKQSSKLNQSKLLALLVYKNIYPEDFTNLSYDKGVLYNALVTKKKVYITSMIETLNSKLVEIDAELKRLDEVKNSNVKELRAIYLINFIANLTDFRYFVINGDEVTIDGMLEEGNFDYLTENKCRYYRYNHGTVPVSVSFDTIEKQIQSSRNYEDKLSDIENYNVDKVNDLKKRTTKCRTTETGSKAL